MRRLPRPGAVLQRQVRRSELRHRQGPDRPRRDHLRRLSLDHAHQRPHRQRGVHDRAAQHYPFAFSENPSLQWINNQLIKSKPEFHKKTFLKPFHKSAEFCSTCHKVHLPVELNHYKEFLRGQNHYDTFLLSGAGNGCAALYYPPKGKSKNCRIVPHAARTERRLRRKGFRRDRRSQASHPLLSGREYGPVRVCSCSRIATKIAHSIPEVDRQDHRVPARSEPDGSDKKLRIDLFGIKRSHNLSLFGESPIRCVRRQQLDGAAPDAAAVEAGGDAPRRGRDPHAQHRPPVHAGDGRLERDLGRFQGHGRRQE